MAAPFLRPVTRKTIPRAPASKKSASAQRKGPQCAPRFGYGIKLANCAVAVLAILAAAAVVAPANGHDWYPKDCCHDMDCAPVESASAG